MENIDQHVSHFGDVKCANVRIKLILKRTDLFQVGMKEQVQNRAKMHQPHQKRIQRFEPQHPLPDLEIRPANLQNRQHPNSASNLENDFGGSPNLQNRFHRIWMGRGSPNSVLKLQNRAQMHHPHVG